LSEEVIFSFDGSLVMRRRHATRPAATDSFCTRPSGEAA
jgi:hypothetical protein